VRALLDGAVDYAGLSPPAQLTMVAAVREYAAQRASDDAWMLGRFVVGAAKLGEFAREAEPLFTPGGELWALSVLIGPEPAADIAAVAAFNAAHRGAMCDMLEAKAATPEDVTRIAAAARGTGLPVYVEVPAAGNPAPLIDAIASRGLRAKVRTGGVTPDAFPAPGEVVGFFTTCLRTGVAFKATAGLHHPLRGEYALTYDAASPRGAMYGFLNVFLAVALLRDGGSASDAEALLTERDPRAFQFGAEGVRWRDALLLTPRLAQARDRAVVSFGSCSFAEPVAGLRELSLL